MKLLRLKIKQIEDSHGVYVVWWMFGFAVGWIFVATYIVCILTK